MNLSKFVPFFQSIVIELTSSSDESNKFRLKNYKKWVKLLEEAIAEEDIEIESADDIDELSIPDKMKIKMHEIFNDGSINGKKVEPTETHHTDKLSHQAISLKPKYKLQDFYGFGETTSRKFQEANGINAEDLLDDWRAYIADSPENEIIMLSKRPRPASFTKQAWELLSEDKQHEKAYMALWKDLEAKSRYLHLLNYHQLIGVKHYFNIMKKIPRSEMMKIEKVLKKALNIMNPELVLTICGSYRRGRAESGDIDCLITHPKITTSDNVVLLGNIVKGLTNCGFLVDHLTENGGTKYMGLCKIAETPRRIDIRIIPWDSYPYAILYFTGSKNNNTDMRIVAKKKGYKLNEYGMESILDHSMVKCNTEEDIYEYLGMKYLTPTERDY